MGNVSPSHEGACKHANALTGTFKTARAEALIQLSWPRTGAPGREKCVRSTRPCDQDVPSNPSCVVDRTVWQRLGLCPSARLRLSRRVPGRKIPLTGGSGIKGEGG